MSSPQLAAGATAGLVGGGWGFMANPFRVAKGVLVAVTGFYSAYALAAWMQDVSRQTAFFSLSVLFLWAACGLLVHARIRQRQINIRWARTVLTVAAAIMVGFVMTLGGGGGALIVGLVFAGPLTLLALAYWLIT